MPAPSGSPTLEVVDLSIRYGDLVAVDELSFNVSAGELVTLLGPNGAGKTSTVECLEGYRRPTHGRVRVLGLDPDADHAALTRRVGVMPQSGGVYTGIRPIEVLKLFAAYYEDPLDPHELLERVGLTDRARSTWRHLSGGEQQRLSLALALVGRPEVAFLDEPTAGVDPHGRRLIRSVVSGLRDDGVTVVLTTHDLDEAERLADRVLIIDGGRLLADGSPHELVGATGSNEVRFGAAPGLDISGLAARVGAPVTEVSPGEYQVAAPPTPNVVATVTSWLAERDLTLRDLRAGRHTLEDVFLRLTATESTETSGASTPERPRHDRRASRKR